MGMMVGQKSKANTKAKTVKREAKIEQPPNGQPNIQMITMEQAILNGLGLIQRTVANIERQQLILGGKIDAVMEKLNE